MEKFVHFEKLPKKEQKKQNAARRNTWDSMSPVTRKPKNSRAYDRQKNNAWRKDTYETAD